MEKINWALLLEYLKVFIWPALIIFLVLYFKDQVKNFLNKVTHFKGPGGVELDTKGEISAQTETASNEEKLRKLNDELENEKANANNLKFQLHFEKSYRLIFQSQLRILGEINSSTEKKLAEEYLRKTYEHTIWHPSYPFESYVGFLTNSFFLSKEKNYYSITLLGEAFLTYISNEILLDKPNDTKA